MRSTHDQTGRTLQSREPYRMSCCRSLFGQLSGNEPLTSVAEKIGVGVAIAASRAAMRKVRRQRGF